MDVRKIKKLIELAKESEVAEIEVTSGEESVRISLHGTNSAVQYVTQPAAAPVPMPSPTQSNEAHSSQPAESNDKHDGHTLKSPMVGTVYLASTPGAKPFVEVGQRIKAGDTICIIEAMKMFNQIEADISGVISARLIENAEPVEYNQALFVITPDE